MNAGASHACNRAIVLYRRHRTDPPHCWRDDRSIDGSGHPSDRLYTSLHRMPLPPSSPPLPRRSSVEYNTVNPAMTCMTLTRDLQGRMKGMTCSPMMQMLTCMTINHQASHCGTMYTGLPISCSVPPSCSDCVGFHNFCLMTDYKQ